MADNTPTQPPAPAATHTPRRFFSTPPGLIAGGLALWVLSFTLSGAMTLAIGRSVPATATGSATPPDRTAIILTAYIGYTVPILIAVGGTVMLIIGSIRWAVYGRQSCGVPAEPQDNELLGSINERLLLSDTAKRIAYRHEDMDLLRSTIKADIEHHEYDAAMVLVHEIGMTYGHKEEAEEYREQILYARTTDIEAKLDHALAKLDETLARHDFETATKEAFKIQRLYTDSPRAQNVHRKVSHARAQYKHDLEREFLEAAQADDVDRAMDLLKILDRYLTEQEAEPYRETARGIIGKKRENHGVQFKMAVHDKQWLQAVAVGEQIIREFPNTRMADEVRGLIDLLRERAAGERAAASRPHEARNRATDPPPYGNSPS